MADPSSSSPSGRVAVLAESFLDRYRKGERPALAEYTDRYPELADEIRLVFPAMVEMERLGPLPGAAEPTGPFADGAPADGPAIRQIGDYLVLREIGRGGMGVVYEAEQASLGRHVALKVLPGHVRLDPKLRERFRREARAAAKLHHTNIVPVFGVGAPASARAWVSARLVGLTSHVAIEHPSAASWMTSSLPIPDPPPVTTARFPRNDSMLTPIDARVRLSVARPVRAVSGTPKRGGDPGSAGGGRPVRCS